LSRSACRRIETISRGFRKLVMTRDFWC
jgi:hypothetical protein